MWPLVRDFFTTKSVAVRVLRLVIVTIGATWASGNLPLPESWDWAGFILTTIGAAITQQNGTAPNEGSG